MASLNEMTPKTRVMIILSIVSVVVMWIVSKTVSDSYFIIFIVAPVILYWGYRFVNEGTNIK